MKSEVAPFRAFGSVDLAGETPLTILLIVNSRADPVPSQSLPAEVDSSPKYYTSIKVAVAIVAATTFAVFMGCGISKLCSSKKKTPDPEGQADALYQEGNNAYSRFLESKSSEDVAEAIRSFKKALELATQPGSFRSNILLGLVYAMLEDPSRANDLQEVETYFAELEKDKIRDSQTKDRYRTIAFDLAEFYEDQFKHARENSAAKEDSFQKSLAYYHKAANKYSDDPKEKVAALLSSARLRIDGKRDADFQGALVDLEEARRTYPTGDSVILLDVSRTFREVHKSRYRSRNDMSCLSKAIAECKTSLEIPDLQPDQRQEALNDLVRCLGVLLDNHPSDARSVAVDKQIMALLHEAFEEQPVTVDANTDPDTIKQATVLANVLSHRSYEPTITDLDKALSLYHKVHPCSMGDATMLRNMAEAIWLRCVKTSNFERFPDIFKLYETAACKTDDLASSIAVLYVKRSGRYGASDDAVAKEISDLDVARRCYLDAAELCPDENDKREFEDQATKIEENIQLLREGKVERGSLSRGLTLERRSTHRKPTLLE